MTSYTTESTGMPARVPERCSERGEHDRQRGKEWQRGHGAVKSGHRRHVERQDTEMHADAKSGTLKTLKIEKHTSKDTRKKVWKEVLAIGAKNAGVGSVLDEAIQHAGHVPGPSP